MKISIFILGLLIKHGSQHGYNLQQLINKKIFIFTKIKMPSLYYHLDSMQKKNFISVFREQDGKRPERFVYSITEKGISYFQKCMEKVLVEKFEIEFLLDSVFLFWNTISIKKVYDSLNARLHEVEKKMEKLHNFKNEPSKKNPISNKNITEILFMHHEYHYKAEIEWLKNAIDILFKAYFERNKSYLSEKI
jgi:DNA-binding PadR family transcriptional regulator